MWDLRFDDTTKRGIRVCFPTLTPGLVPVGEFSILRHKENCAWFLNTPQRYQYVDGVFSEFPGWAAELTALAETIAAQNTMIAVIEQAKETAGIHKLTVKEAQNYISDRINKTTTVPEIKEAVIDILQKIVTYLPYLTK